MDKGHSESMLKKKLTGMHSIAGSIRRPNDVHQMHRICLSRQQYLAQSLGEFASKLNHLLYLTIVLLVYMT